MAGGVIGIVGFVLSPLSWWNDLFVNVPLAVGFGWIISLAWKPAFEPAVVVGYWITNALGLILLHHGARAVVAALPPPPYTRRALLKDCGVSFAYTAVIVALVQFGVLKPVSDYLKSGSSSDSPKPRRPKRPQRPCRSHDGSGASAQPRRAPC